MEKINDFKPAPIPAEEQRSLISVVVPVYNIEAYLVRCVKSIQDQTYRNLQIILIDDGSTDGSPAICEALAQKDSRIRVLHKKNGGLSSARNAGILLAQGEYIAFVDGDDWIEPKMYESMLSAAIQFNAPLCVCRYKQVYKDHTEDASERFAAVYEGQEALECFLLEEDSVAIQNAAWNKLYRKELMGELRFPEGRNYEDIVYTTRLLGRAERTVYLDMAFYNYILERNGSIMGEGIGERIFTDQIPAYEEKEAYLLEIGRPDLADIHRYFFLKRLLLYYVALSSYPREKRLRFRARLRRLIEDRRPDKERIYSCKGANPNEKKKMEIFLFSPRLYVITIWVNERFLIPLKQFLKRSRRTGG